jgi:hypothetical protein
MTCSMDGSSFYVLRSTDPFAAWCATGKDGSRVGEGVAPSPSTDPEERDSPHPLLTRVFVPSGIAVDEPGHWQPMTGVERVEVSPYEQPSSRSTFRPLV